MRVDKDLIIVEPWPVLYVESERTLIVSDLHLGIEEQYEREGIHVPGTFLNEIIFSVKESAKDAGAEKIVILGDVKHEFGKPQETEWYGVKKLIKELSSYGKLAVVRGNHDNYIINILRDYGVPLYLNLKVGNYFLTHGHIFYTKNETGKKVIIGHEHPTVSIKDDLGVRHRFKAFLKTNIESRDIVVLPSASRITLGTDINVVSPFDLLSPFLNGKELADSIPYVIEPGIEVKRFPKVSLL
jgi:putative SbcD/Mre11-related phosphoesterase